MEFKKFYSKKIVWISFLIYTIVIFIDLALASLLYKSDTISNAKHSNKCYQYYIDNIDLLYEAESSYSEEDNNESSFSSLEDQQMFYTKEFLKDDLIQFQECEEYRQYVINRIEASDVPSNSFQGRYNNKIKSIFEKDLDFFLNNYRFVTKIIYYDYHLIEINIISIMLIILLCSNIFVYEHERGMYKLLISTVKGYNITYWNKMLISISISILVALVQSTLYCISSMILYDIKGLGSPIQCLSEYKACPYNITIGQGLLILLALKIFSYSLIAVISSNISLWFQKSVYPAIASMALLLGFCMFFIYISNYNTNFFDITKYNIYKIFKSCCIYNMIFKAKEYLLEFDCVNVLGYPISRLTINLTINGILLIIILILGNYIYKNRFKKVMAI